MHFLNNKNSAYILSIDAKDLFISNNYINPDSFGYNIRTRTGDINFRKFINSADFSLDLIKLREIYEKVYRRIDFSFSYNNKEYTQRLINVNFNYSNKEFNRATKNIYLKFGYKLSEIELIDHVCIKNGELAAIRVGEIVENPQNTNLLGKYFYLDDGKYCAKSNIKTLNSVEDLRSYLYKNGFYCDGIKYIRFKRSNGSSRIGKCLFIDERLYNRINKWQLCGLKVKENDDIDLAALEAYISLTLSSIEDTVELYPRNFLIIEDHCSVFKDTVAAVSISNGELVCSEKEIDVSNNIWDGQSLVDESVFPAKYKKFGMMLLRNRFFKTAGFNTNIQTYFSENKITSISQLNGFTLAEDISDIKIITTPSSIKYLKFANVRQWLKNLEPTFGIVKHEKPTHFFDGELVSTHYQLLNTLQLSQAETDKFLQPSLEYITKLKTDPAVLRNHIKYPTYSDFTDEPAKNVNDIVYKLLGINDKFAKTKIYTNFVNTLVRAQLNELRCGHVLVHGNYSTMIGNPIEMLNAAIGKFDGTPFMKPQTVYTRKFKHNCEILGSRSPHVTIGNILITKNTVYPEIDQYFNFSNEIVCINSINENILNRLSGSDFDSDTIMLTDNQILINAAKRNYNNFLVPSSMVEARKISRKYNAEELADLDTRTSVNKIGEIINLAQDLNTLLWDNLHKGQSISENTELYYDISILDVLSNIEIDKAKKEFDISSTNEINKIKAKYLRKDEDGKTIKPNFFGYIAKDKGYYDTKTKKYLKHNTTMDYVQTSINKYKRKKAVTEIIPFTEIIDKSNYRGECVNLKQINNIIDLMRTMTAKCKQIYADCGISNSDKFGIILDLRFQCIDYLDKIRMNSSTMFMLLCLIETPSYSDIYKFIFLSFFDSSNHSFYELIKKSKERIDIIYENSTGEIDLYGIKFSKK